MELEAPWRSSFEVTDTHGVQIPSAALPLTQVDSKRFQVGATLTYLGDTGLDPDLDDQIRTLHFDEHRRSDLASVPLALGWFERAHGAHTPAALFHDYFIAPDTPLSRPQADLYFRNILGSVGVAPVKRYVMWSGVALLTRWLINRAVVVLWVMLSLAGLVLFSLAAVNVALPSWLGGRLLVLIVAGAAPLPASLLWGSQRGAALVAAVVAIWMLPAAAIAFSAIGLYRLLELLVSSFGN